MKNVILLDQFHKRSESLDDEQNHIEMKQKKSELDAN